MTQRIGIAEKQGDHPGTPDQPLNGICLADGGIVVPPGIFSDSVYAGDHQVISLQPANHFLHLGERSVPVEGIVVGIAIPGDDSLKGGDAVFADGQGGDFQGIETGQGKQSRIFHHGQACFHQGVSRHQGRRIIDFRCYQGQVGRSVVIQSQPSFHRQHPGAFFIDLLLPECSRKDGLFDGCNALWQVRHKFQHVIAGFQRFHVSASRREDHTRHVHGISYHQSAISQFFPKYAVDDFPGEGGRPPRGIIHRNRQMGCHDTGNALLCQHPERMHLNTVHPDSGMLQQGQHPVGIAPGIAVPRKMLGHGSHPFILQPFCIGQNFQCYILFLLPEGSDVNHRIVRIGVDVGHGGEIHVDADALQLPADLPAHLINQSGILYSPQTLSDREIRNAVEPEPQSRLRIGGHQKRHPRCFLKIVDPTGCLHR